MRITRKRVLISLAIAVFELTVIAAGLEIYLRMKSAYITGVKGMDQIVVDPEQLIVHTPNGNRLAPNTQAVFHNHILSHRDITITINSLGFRDEEIPESKEENEVRVLVLGDSITWGDYLEADEVYVKQAEQRLQAAYPKRLVRVINAGVGDIGTQEELDVLRNQGLRVHPDIVVLAFYLNDSRPPWGFTEEIGHRGWLRQHSLLAETIYRNIKLNQWIREKGLYRSAWAFLEYRNDWRNDRNGFLSFAHDARIDWGAAWDEGSWTSLAGPFDELEKLSQDHGFRVVLLALPVRYQVDASFIEDLPQRKLHEIAESYGWSFLDLLPILRQHQTEDLYFDQAHPTVRGNEIIGQALADYLVSSGFVQPYESVQSLNSVYTE